MTGENNKLNARNNKTTKRLKKPKSQRSCNFSNNIDAITKVVLKKNSDNDLIVQLVSVGNNDPVRDQRTVDKDMTIETRKGTVDSEVDVLDQRTENKENITVTVSNEMKRIEAISKQKSTKRNIRKIDQDQKIDKCKKNTDIKIIQ